MPFLNLPFHTCILPGYKGLILVYSPSLWRWQKVIIKTHNHLTGSMDLSWGMTHDWKRIEDLRKKNQGENKNTTHYSTRLFLLSLVDPQSHISYICMYTYFHIYKCLHAFMSMFLFSNKKIHPPGFQHTVYTMYQCTHRFSKQKGHQTPTISLHHHWPSEYSSDWDRYNRVVRLFQPCSNWPRDDKNMDETPHDVVI